MKRRTELSELIEGNLCKNSYFYRSILKANDKFYIFSDGFQDQFGGPEKGNFMRKNLKKLFLEINHLPMAEQKEILERTFDEWKGELPQVDDILIIGFSV